MSGTSNSSGPKTKLSRRKFLLGSAVTAASAAFTMNSERANAFFNTFGFMKKSAGSGQTSNGYAIGQSLRFNSANSAYLSRTPPAGSNTNKWTFSVWVKRAYLSNGSSDQGAQGLLGSSYGNRDYLRFSTTYSSADPVDNALLWNQANTANFIYTNSLYRDPSAWYHVVFAYDNTQSGSNITKLYVNGLPQTFTVSGSQPSGATTINSPSYTTVIGCDLLSLSRHYFDGYMAETYFIDAQALDATYFGQVDTNTGQWIPKNYSGTYSGNSSYLKFANSGNLGLDSSGLGNNWTPSGFATHDQVLDSPTNNFCTLNQLQMASATMSGGSLTIANGGYTSNTTSTLAIPSTGKWYLECTFTNATNMFGLIQPSSYATSYMSLPTDAIRSIHGTGTVYRNEGDSYNYGASLASGVWMMAVDADNGKVYFGNAGTGLWGNGTGAFDQAWASAVAAYSDLSSKTWVIYSRSYSNTLTINAGQGGQTGLVYDTASGGRFKYTPPAGFKALCTANLPAPTIKMPAQHFSVVTYMGNGASQTISSLAFRPDLLWFKDRTSAQSHALQDSVRGVGAELQTDTTNGDGGTGGLTSINSNGFTVSNGTRYNTLNDNYVAWCWKAGTSAQSGNESYNANAGFSIVKYTGSGTGQNIPHSLGTAPSLIIVKNRSASTRNSNSMDWIVYHKEAASTVADRCLRLNTTEAKLTGNGSGFWNNTDPTSTVFSIGTHERVNYSGDNFVAYLWAEVAGFSKFGSYTGNGSADGPFVYCGFKPRWIMLKLAAVAGYDWYVLDTARDNCNAMVAQLYADSNSAEGIGAPFLDVTSNGFKIRSNSAAFNSSGNTTIFAAFAEAPFKYATAR